MSQHDVERYLEKIADWWLEDSTLEELLEQFDISPGEALKSLFHSGLINEDDLEQFVVDV
jgi:hypothetical protein